jgi:hypothetical protein
MRIPKPKFKHSPVVLADIIKANGSDPVGLAHCLQQLGWTLADAPRAPHRAKMTDLILFCPYLSAIQYTSRIHKRGNGDTTA